jgi:peroxiredoxin
MPFIESNAGNDAINIYYQDGGAGPAVVLIHGWPLSQRMWEYQIDALTDANYRCIAYDRRGFGESDKPWTGYNYDVMAADLHELIVQLDLKDAAIVGFSMGGGEVARYFGRYGSERVSKAMLVSAVCPYLLKTDNNPDGGMKQADVEGMIQGVKDDRTAFLDSFGKTFVNWSKDEPTISQPLLQYNHTIASFASPRATKRCITAFSETDFREDLKKIDVPVLIVHGKADQIVPAEVSAHRSAEMIADSQLELIENAPHGLNFTHPDQLNNLMLDFLGS